MLFDAPPPLLLFFLALDIVAILRAVTRSRGVELTLAWIFAILALPGLGAIAYLLVANPSIRGMTRRKRLTHEAVRGTLLHGLGATYAISGSGSAPLLQLAASTTDFSPTGGNAISLLAGDEHAFEHMEAALMQAKRSIWVEYYIIKNDQTGHRFLDILAAKAAEGLEVRLLYDAIGSLRLDAKRLAALSRAGGRLSPFLRVNPLRRRWAVHLRNHRKLIVIDGELGFTGGMNIGDEYSGRARRKKSPYFRDAHLALRGPAVLDLSAIFIEDWRFATEEALLAPLSSPVPVGDAVIAVVPSGPDQEHNASWFVYFASITAARQRCYLTSPYFVPDETLLRSLMTAAMRGVDVRVLVPERSDVPLVRAVARSYYAALVHSGVRIYEYQPSLLHAKTLVVDGQWSIVGSANTDVRSFRLNFELGVLTVDESFAALLEQSFLEDARASAEITLEWLSRRTPLARLASNAAKLLSPLL
jgi:cardiolipin synthase